MSIEQQVTLSCPVTEGCRELRTTAIVQHKRVLSPGDMLTLKDSDDPDRLWTVVESYPLPRSIPRGWNNNI